MLYLCQQLNISQDRYIRTTEPEHEKTAQWLFQRADDAGDIYLHTYEGWYNVREERFVADTEAEMNDFKDEYGYGSGNVVTQLPSRPC